MATNIKGMKQLQSRLDSLSQPERFLARLQTEVTREAKARVPRKTGNLGRSIRAGYLSAHRAYVVADAGYALYVEKGTGIYGPKKRPIVPRTKKALAFHAGGPGARRLSGRMTVGADRKYGSGSDLVVVKSVKGRRATPFMEPAAHAVVEKHGLKNVAITLWNEGA
jgi:hypothetical protein